MGWKSSWRNNRRFTQNEDGLHHPGPTRSMQFNYGLELPNHVVGVEGGTSTSSVSRGSRFQYFRSETDEKLSSPSRSGCTVVIKPSELTPLTTLALCNLAQEAGFPAGVLNVIPGFGPTAGAALASHMDVDKVSFTGSVLTGKKIMVAAAESNLKKVSFSFLCKFLEEVWASADLRRWVGIGYTRARRQITFDHLPISGSRTSCGVECVGSLLQLGSGLYRWF